MPTCCEGLSLQPSCSWLFSLQGLAVLVLFCVLNEEVQEAWKLACLGKKGQSEETARSTQVSGHLESWGLAACWEMKGCPFFTKRWDGKVLLCAAPH